MHATGGGHGPIGETTATCVLVVDDDPSVVDLASAYLEHDLEAVDVRVETDPRDAISVFDDDFDCVICDYSMPELDGLDVVAELERRAPETRFVIFSGTADASDIEGVDHVDRFVRKGAADAFGRLAAAVDELA